MAEKRLPPPHKYIYTEWNMDEIREALEKSRAALLNNLTSTHDLLINLANVENLFLVHTTKVQEEKQNGVVDSIGYVSYVPDGKRGGWEWGSRDIMLDLGDDDAMSSQQQQQRMAILTAAANLTGRAVHLLLHSQYEITEEEERALVEALSLAADRDEGPSSLLICTRKLRDVPALLSALNKNKCLKHLSLQRMEMSDECVEVLRDFRYLTSLHLQSVELDVKLADLHPSHSPLAASLQRLHIHSRYPFDWRRSTGFLRTWPLLKELSLISYSKDMSEDELMDFMDHLAPPKKGAETAGSTLPSSPPQLYSLQLGGDFSGHELSRSATAAVVDALSRSGLPFLEFVHQHHRMDPAIEVQLWRNHNNFILGLDSIRVPASSIQLFICGDPFPGKNTLISTIRSMYGRKSAKCMGFHFARKGHTEGIEVEAVRDISGQQEFHAFNDFMFPDVGTSSYQRPSMFMFVWNPADRKNSYRGSAEKEVYFEASFRYWLRFLASKSRQSNIILRVIVVFTGAKEMQIASSSLSHSVNSLRSEFKSVIDIVDRIFDVDARKTDSIKPLAQRILVIAKDMLQGIQVYNICTEVSKRLSRHLKNTNQEIITWETFGEICHPLHSRVDDDKLKAIAQCLNDSGNIIYIKGMKYIILNPNLFYNQVIGSLIGFSNSKASKSTIVFTNGWARRDSLEESLESIAKPKVKGSLLVDLMEAMHLCYRVTINHGAPSSNADLIFIPPLLINGGVEQLQWASSTCMSNVNDDTFVYMGRRLECEDKNHTILTEGLFPRIQVLFKNVFQSFNSDNGHIALGKDFIYICFPKIEIIIMFCQAKSEHVIDVLVRANNPNNNQYHKLETLLDMELKCITNALVTICAQPTGIQGVKLIESVIRPDSLHDPSRAQDREDQCVDLTYLRTQLRKKLEQGDKELQYDWEQTRHMPHSLSNSFLYLLGLNYYAEVLKSCLEWFKVEVRNALLENDKVNVLGQYQNYRENAITINLGNNLVHEGQITNSDTIEVQSIKFMIRSILSLRRKVDATHEKVLELHDQVNSITKNLEEIHKEISCMREDVISKVENFLSKLLKIAERNEIDSQKQLPLVPLLTIQFLESTFEKPLTSVSLVSGGKSLRLQLYCEDKKLPHPVENQPGITLTSLSKSQSKYLDEALPYIKCWFNVLTIAARLGISSMVPLASSFIPNWTTHLKLAKQYPMIQSHFDSKKDIFLSKLESASKEWQKCLISMLKENGGLTNENIAKKFHLKRAIYREGDGSTHIAWLCEMHYNGKRPFPRG